MFLEFQKITTGDPTPIIVNSDALLTMNIVRVEDKNTGETIPLTHLEIIGFPKYSFYTATPYDRVISYFNVSDARPGFLSGSPCAGGNTISIIYPQARLPLVRVKAIFNNTIAESEDYTFNLNQMLYAETKIFNDSTLGSQQHGLMIILRDTGPTKIMAKLEYADFRSIVSPTVVS